MQIFRADGRKINIHCHQKNDMSLLNMPNRAGPDNNLRQQLDHSSIPAPGIERNELRAPCGASTCCVLYAAVSRGATGNWSQGISAGFSTSSTTPRSLSRKSRDKSDCLGWSFFFDSAGMCMCTRANRNLGGLVLQTEPGAGVRGWFSPSNYIYIFIHLADTFIQSD